MRKFKLSKRTKLIGKLSACLATGTAISMIKDQHDNMVEELINKIDKWKDKAADNYESLVELKTEVIDKFGEKSYYEIINKINTTSLPF